MDLINQLKSADKKMKVLCISGKAQHGKDTVALALKGLMEMQNKNVLVAHYGDLVKYVCEKFFGWDGKKDEKGRALLQYVGTDVVRAKYPDYWVRFIADMLEMFNGTWDYVLIPDCRFPNEIDVLRDQGLNVFHLRVVRPNFTSSLTEEQLKHISETALDNVEPDAFVINNASLGKLTTQLMSMQELW